MEKSGIDDKLKILAFIFVQIKQKYIDSDKQHTELFQNIFAGDIESKIAYMKITCNIIINIKWNNLIDVTEEEFENKFKK